MNQPNPSPIPTIPANLRRGKGILAMILLIIPLVLLTLHYFGALPVPQVEVKVSQNNNQTTPQQGSTLTQPQTGNTLAPAVTEPTLTGHLGRLIEDSVYYEEQGVEGIKVYDQTSPIELELDAQHLSNDELEELRVAAEQEINRPKSRGNKVTKVTKVRFLLSDDLQRIVGALLFIQGENANGEPLAEQNKVAATRVVFASHIWTVEHSNDWSEQILSELHDRLGEPDRGEVHQRRVLGVRTRLVQLPQE